MRATHYHAGNTNASTARAPWVLLSLGACGVLLGATLLPMARAEVPLPIAFLQGAAPAQHDTAESPTPTPAELRAVRETRIASMAARLAAGRDSTFEPDLMALVFESQQQIASEIHELSHTLTAAQYENCATLEQAALDSEFARQYLENATGHSPIPKIISINFPAFENPNAPNSSLVPAEHWNNAPVNCNEGTVPLVDDRGETTQAELWFESAGSGTHTPLRGGRRSDQALMQAGIRAWWNNPGQLEGPPVTVRIENLNLAMQHGYQVYVYMGMGISNEPAGGAPFHITIGEGTPLFGGRQLNAFTGEWVRIDATNHNGNYLVSPLLAKDKLLIEMAPVGFYPDIKLGCTAINGIQLVGARPRTLETEHAELSRAATSARAAQAKLNQASQEVSSAPPSGEVAPNASARLARLARWQGHVAEQLEALDRGDFAAAISAMEQELAHIPSGP